MTRTDPSPNRPVPAPDPPQPINNPENGKMTTATAMQMQWAVWPFRIGESFFITGFSNRQSGEYAIAVFSDISQRDCVLIAPAVGPLDDILRWSRILRIVLILVHLSTVLAAVWIRTKRSRMMHEGCRSLIAEIRSFSEASQKLRVRDELMIRTRPNLQFVQLSRGNASSSPGAAFH